jgi:hypothetical protein
MNKLNSVFLKRKYAIFIALLTIINISISSSPKHQGEQAFILFSDSFEVGLDSWDLVRYQSQSSGFKYIPPILDSSTAAQGETSLKISNHRQDIILLETKVMPLLPKQRYTASLYLKTDYPGLEVNVALKSGIQNIILKNFKLDDQWKRYSLSLIVSRSKNKNYRISLSFRGKGTLWIDGVQLEKGELSDLDFNPPIRFNAQTERKTNLYIEGEKPQATISVFNHSSIDQKIIIDYHINDFFQHEITRNQLAMYCQKGKSAKKTIALPFAITGIFKALFSLNYENQQDNRQKELIYAIIPKRSSSELNQDSPFGIHLQLLAPKGKNAKNISYERIYPSRCSFEDYFYWAECIGAKWLRDRDFLTWSYVEPRKGEFNWFDEYIDLAEKHHLNVLGNLRIYPNIFDKRPWGKSDDFGLKKRSLPSLEAWKSYVGAVVSRYKDRIKYWEILNEPNARFYPRQYVELLKVTYTTAKAIDPDCKIVAPACMVMRSPRRNFLKNILDLGAGKYCDIFSVHFYMKPKNQAPEKTLPTLQTAFETYKKMIEDYGGKQELWDSESGYSVRSYYEDLGKNFARGKSKGDRNSITAEEQANYIVRNYIIHIANGVKWFYFNLGKRSIYVYGIKGLIEYDTTPLPAMVAYAVLSRKLEGMHFETKIDMPKGNECYIFSKKNETSKSRPLFLIAAWNWQVVSEEVKWYIAIPPSKLNAYNIMGNEVSVEPYNKGFFAKISGSPLYFEGSEIELNNLIKAFQNIQYNY